MKVGLDAARFEAFNQTQATCFPKHLTRPVEMNFVLSLRFTLSIQQSYAGLGIGSH